MPSSINDAVFGEPSGRQHAFVMFAGSLVMVGIYSYYDLIRDGAAISSLLMACGFALSGVAESLPTERRQLAGGLRIAAVLLFVGLLGLTIVAPQVIFGPQ